MRKNNINGLEQGQISTELWHIVPMVLCAAKNITVGKAAFDIIFAKIIGVSPTTMSKYLSIEKRTSLSMVNMKRFLDRMPEVGIEISYNEISTTEVEIVISVKNKLADNKTIENNL